MEPGPARARNGRIDRTLQSEPEVRCHYFCYPQRSEDEVVRKVGQIQRDLGSVGAIVFDGIADRLERSGLDRSVLEHIEQDERRVRSTTRAAQELEEARSEGLADEIQQAERLLNQSRAVLELDPPLLREAIDVGLEWDGAEPLKEAASPKEEPGLKAPQLPALGPGWAATLDSAQPARRRDEPAQDPARPDPPRRPDPREAALVRVHRRRARPTRAARARPQAHRRPAGGARRRAGGRAQGHPTEL